MQRSPSQRGLLGNIVPGLLKRLRIKVEMSNAGFYRTLAMGGLIVMATLAVYVQTIGFDFVNFDDPHYVSNNEYVKAGLTLESFRWAMTTGHLAMWHPVTSLSHMLDGQLFGLAAGGYHATNALIHVLNTLLLFAVLNRMTHAPCRSAVVAALFALHPLHVESVVWISARKDMLSFFFAMLVLGSYIAYVEHRGIKRYLLVVLLFALGLMSKPMLVTLPILMLLLDYWPLDRIRLMKAASSSQPGCRQLSVAVLVAEKIPLLALAVATSAVTYAKQDLAMQRAISLPLRVANGLMSYARYVGKTFWPTELSVLYPHPNIVGGTPWTAWQIAAAATALAAATIMMMAATRRRYYIVGWLWFLGTLVPVLGLVQVGTQAMADRYTYLPQIGLFIIIAWGVADLTAPWQERKMILNSVAALLVAALLAYAGIAFVQARHWRNSITLNHHSINITPTVSTLHIALGNALIRQNRNKQAIASYRHAVELAPYFARAHHTLAIALARQDRFDEAVQHFERATTIAPNRLLSRLNFAQALRTQGRSEDAIEQLQEAVRIAPDDARPHIALASVLVSENKPDRAITPARRAVRLTPQSADAHYILAAALTMTGQYDDAISHFRESAHLKPDWLSPTHELARALIRYPVDHQGTEAIRWAKRAAELTDHRNPVVLDTLAAAYASAGQFNAAIDTAKKAIELATKANDFKLVEEINARLSLYRRSESLPNEQDLAP